MAERVTDLLVFQRDDDTWGATSDGLASHDKQYYNVSYWWKERQRVQLENDVVRVRVFWDDQCETPAGYEIGCPTRRLTALERLKIALIALHWWEIPF